MRGAGSKGLRLSCVAVWVLWGLACSKTSDDDSEDASSDAPSAASLGEEAPATGTPVKIGLITDGGDCNQCAAAAGEEPVAKAAVAWLNQYRHGVAGHPVSLDICVDDLDPGKAADCANQMIRDDVAAVVIGSNGVIETSWKLLHDAHIPVINNGATNAVLLQDPESTFVINDPYAQIVDYPIAVAEKAGADRVSAMVIDLPIATGVYKGTTERTFEDAGVELDVVPVPIGTPDMTPQAQQVVADNPDGTVVIVGHDQFCIPALNGLRAAGFEGSTIVISQCLTEATRKAVPGDVLDGLLTASIAPVGEDDDPSMREYRAVLAKFADEAGEEVDPNEVVGLGVFQSFGALSAATQGLQGEVTPASVTAAIKAMGNEELPASGGRVFRCNGKASTFGPALCSSSMAVATLDSHGDPAKYTVENNSPIGD